MCPRVPIGQFQFKSCFHLYSSTLYNILYESPQILWDVKECGVLHVYFCESEMSFNEGMCSLISMCFALVL